MQEAAECSSAGLGGANSKKDSTVRRRELLGNGQASMAGRLAAACSVKAAELLVSPKAVDLLLEAACGGEAGVRTVDSSCPQYLSCCNNALYEVLAAACKACAFACVC